MPSTIEVPTTVDEVKALANLYFQASHVKSKHKSTGNVAYVILYCIEHKINITEGLQFIYLIGDKLASQAELMLSLVYRSKEVAVFNEEIIGDFKDGTAKAVCMIQRTGFDKKEFTFSIADAKTANLWNRNNIWKQYPYRMLKMRARTFALKDTFSDVLGGLTSIEEATDIITHKEDSKPKTITTPKPVQIEQHMPLKISARPEVAQATQPELIKAPEVYTAAMFDEKYIIDSKGNFHMSSGITLLKGEIADMKDMTDKEKKVYYADKTSDSIGTSNEYTELFPVSEDK